MNMSIIMMLILLILISSYTIVVNSVLFNKIENEYIRIIPVVASLDPNSLEIKIISQGTYDYSNALSVILNNKPILTMWPTVSYFYIVNISKTLLISRIPYTPLILSKKYFNYTRPCGPSCLEFYGNTSISDKYNYTKNINAKVRIDAKIQEHEHGFLITIYYDVYAYSKDNNTLGITFDPLGKIFLRNNSTNKILYIYYKGKEIISNRNTKEHIICNGPLDCPGIVIYYNDTKTAIVIPQQGDGVIADIYRDVAIASFTSTQVGGDYKEIGPKILSASGVIFIYILENINPSTKEFQEIVKNPYMSQNFLGKPITPYQQSEVMPRAKTANENIANYELLYIAIGVILGFTPSMFLYLVFTRKIRRELEKRSRFKDEDLSDKS